MLRIAICDDDAMQIKITEQAVLNMIGSRGPEIELFSTGTELLAALEKGGYRPDIAILDIQMPVVGGIAVGQRINGCVPACRIIFLTSFLGYATDVYEVRHSYFILKSELHQRIGPALARAMEELGGSANITFRANGDTCTVAAEEVMYLERNLRKVSVVCLRETYVTSSRPEELMTDVSPGMFVQCHQSYWVNLSHVTAMGGETFTLANDAEIPISRSRRPAAKEAFFAHLHRSAT